MLKGFISYAHADRDLCDMFFKQVNMLKHGRLAEFWADHGIEPGDPWEKVILDQLKQADICLFLISPDMDVTEHAGAQSKAVHELVGQRQIDIRGLLVLIGGLGRVVRPFVSTVAPAVARVTATLKASALVARSPGRL